MILELSPQNLDSYSLWLNSHRYQKNTVRNYLQDLKKFLTFSHYKISTEIISSYFIHLSSKNNSSRYLASLSTFCQFLLDQHLTESNLFKQVKKQLARKAPVTEESLLIQYEGYLIKQHKSSLTVKNYLNDIQQYFTWLKQNPAHES
jgi:site-specific recombinase XerD